MNAIRPFCPNCRSTRVWRSPQPTRNNYTCLTCGNHWSELTVVLVSGLRRRVRAADTGEGVNLPWRM